ncbi:MAG: hypothetical protein DRJ47_04465 [Thermoprotei archaeon]|nr:MAG: hypothetical protein DRJ47_04465 [Thermoprotei archaeon]
MAALPGNPHPVVAVNVAPDKPPTRGEAAEGETHTSSHNIKNNLNTMHGQPLMNILLLYLGIPYRVRLGVYEYYKYP